MHRPVIKEVALVFTYSDPHSTGLLGLCVLYKSPSLEAPEHLPDFCTQYGKVQDSVRQAQGPSLSHHYCSHTKFHVGLY